MSPAPAVRVLVEAAGAVAVVVAGAATAVATALVHSLWWGLAWGLVAGVVAVWALPSAWWGRFSFVAGWIGLTLVVLLGRPEGDFLVANSWSGYLYLGAGLLLVLAAALAPRGRATPARS